MEMEFKSGARRQRLLLIVGVALALFAGGAAFYMSSHGTASGQPVATRTVVVAAQEIPARTVIEQSHLILRKVPDDATYDMAVTDPSQVLGLVTGVSVYDGQPITMNLFATSTAGYKFSILSPTETVAPDSPYWRAVAVQVPKDRAVGGQVLAPQHVDLFTTVAINILTSQKDGSMADTPSREGYYSDKTTKLAWPDLQVLSVDTDNDIYVLRMTLHDAEEVAHLQDIGDTAFALALRPDNDTRTVDLSAFGETTNRIIEQHIFPLPQIINTATYPQPSPLATPSPVPSALASAPPSPASSPAASPPASGEPAIPRSGPPTSPAPSGAASAAPKPAASPSPSAVH
jgi:Flp pilus assembly protein CpaB